MNSTLDLINNRVSLRKYADKEVSDEVLDLVLKGAMRAPTAGNTMMYSIIAIRSEEKKKILAKTCDNQPFIEKAPVVLIFLADTHKMNKYFKVSGVDEFCEKNQKEKRTPDLAQLFLAAGDAFIAAQNAVITAEALGLGTCYIGDIVENHETHKKLLNLPNWTTPVAMLCLGYYPEDYPRNIASRFDEKFVVFKEEYKDLTEDEVREMYSELEAKFPKANVYGAENFGQMLYSRKFGSDFMEEMNNGLSEAVKEWLTK